MRLAAKQAAVFQLIHAYRVRGHLMADLDPLGQERPEQHPELDLAAYGLSMWDLDREFLAGTLRVNGYGIHAAAPLREILETLRQTYCGKLTCEYMHIQHPEEKGWLQERMEPSANRWPLDKTVRIRALERVIEAEEDLCRVLGSILRYLKSGGRQLERRLGEHVHLDLVVRVRRHWRTDESLLDRLGIE